MTSMTDNIPGIVYVLLVWKEGSSPPQCWDVFETLELAKRRTCNDFEWRQISEVGPLCGESSKTGLSYRIEQHYFEWEKE